MSQVQQAPAAVQPQPVQGQPVQGQQQVIIIQQGPPPPPSYLAFSIVMCIFCNPIFGIIAIVFSALSEKDAQMGDLDGAARKGRVALGLDIASIVIGVLIIIIVPAVIVGLAAGAVAGAVTAFG